MRPMKGTKTMLNRNAEALEREISDYDLRIKNKAIEITCYTHPRNISVRRKLLDELKVLQALRKTAEKGLEKCNRS